MKRVLLCFSGIILLFCTVSFAQNKQPDSQNGVQTAFPFYDDVETNSTSSSYWTRDTTIWQIKIANAYSGSQVWAMLPSAGQYNYLTLASNINLSAAANPYLAFWIKKADGGGGYVSLEASGDGGTTWTKYTISGNNNLYTSYFLNGQTGWIGGTNISKTTDGGNTWVVNGSSFFVVS